MPMLTNCNESCDVHVYYDVTFLFTVHTYLLKHFPTVIPAYTLCNCTLPM